MIVMVIMMVIVMVMVGMLMLISITIFWSPLLTCQKIGFSSMRTLRTPSHGAKGFRRPIHEYTK